MKRTTLALLIILVSCHVSAQDQTTYSLFLKFSEFFKRGDFIKAEECMLSVLSSKDKLKPEYTSAAYSNLGAVKSNLGNYEKALEYYDLAETLIINEKQYSIQLADIYNNKAIILGKLKSYHFSYRLF